MIFARAKAMFEHFFGRSEVDTDSPRPTMAQAIADAEAQAYERLDRELARLRATINSQAPTDDTRS